MTWNEPTSSPRHRGSIGGLFMTEPIREVAIKQSVNLDRKIGALSDFPPLGRHAHPYSELAERAGGRHRKPSHRAEVAR